MANRENTIRTEDAGAGPLTPDELVTKELGSVRKDLFGIALSGGGIRSATFNLGLLQGLRKTGLLEHADYVSTASGGGYTGGFWTAWRHRNEKTGFPGAGDGEVEDPAIGHLRRFSNFLSPRLGVFSYDTGRLAVAALTAAIPSLLATASLLLLASIAWGVVSLELLTRSALGVGLMTAATAFVLATFEHYWR
ncbi:MAG: hypothetical protein ACREK1_07315, partial [Longimicrobiales bacterium]